MWQGKGGRAETLTAVAVFSSISHSVPTPPSADGRPTQGQAATVCANSSVSCAVLCCMYVCADLCGCACLPTPACLSQASAQHPGNHRKNRIEHYVNRP